MWNVKRKRTNEKESDALPIGEYEGKGDVKRILKYLRLRSGSLTLRSLLCFICTLLLLAVGIALDKRIDIGMNLKAFSNLYLYLVINVLSVVILVMAGLKDICNGLIRLIRLKPNSDSIIFLSAVGAVAQSIVAFFVKDSIISGDFSLYTSVFGFAVLLDTVGKLYTESKVRRNFKFLLSKKDKFLITQIEGKKNLEQKFGILASKKAVAAVQNKVNEFKNFIKFSYKSNPNDGVIGKIAAINIIILIVGVAVDVAIERDFISAVQIFTLISCLCAPIANIFVVNKCMWRSCKKLIKSNAVLLGYGAVDKFKNLTYVAFNANQIYPKGCVKIKGVRAFGQQHIDDVILNAAAVTNSLPSTLNGVFENALSNKKIKVPEASSVTYESYMGLVGWVNGKRVLVGNRELLKKYKVYPPSQVFEHKCCSKGQHAVYVAVHRDLAAMFIIAYKPDRTIVNDLQTLVKRGIKILVGANDPCVIENSISDDFGVPDNTVQIVKRLEDTAGEGNTNGQETDSIITCDKNVKSFFQGLLSCDKLRYIVSVISAIEVSACAIGLITVLILVLSKGALQVGTIEFLLFTVFWQISMYGVSYICGS